MVSNHRCASAALTNTNTRMKDFFDLWVLLHDTTLDDAELRRAVEATFARRQTAVPSNQPIGLSDVFADDATKQLQWRAFLKKNKLEPVNLGDVGPSASAHCSSDSPARSCRGDQSPHRIGKVTGGRPPHHERPSMVGFTPSHTPPA
jgi:Nucleotidyl transferase AbiEii toxin, Type IV TA system